MSESVPILSLDVHLNLLSLYVFLHLCLFYFSFPEYNIFSDVLKIGWKQKKATSVFSQRTDEASAAQYFQVMKFFSASL